MSQNIFSNSIYIPAYIVLESKYLSFFRSKNYQIGANFGKAKETILQSLTPRVSLTLLPKKHSRLVHLLRYKTWTTFRLVVLVSQPREVFVGHVLRMVNSNTLRTKN